MRSFIVGVVVFAATVSACSTDDGRDMAPPRDDQQESVAPATTVNDPASFDSLPDPSEGAFSLDGPWGTDEPIDARYTCDGRDISPSLSWAGAPSDAVAFAIVMTDLDAPEYAHWTVANIDVNAVSANEGQTPPLAVVAENGKGAASYTGPCPPKGTTHTYQISIYALGQVLEAQSGDPAPAMRAAIETAALDIASTTFTYSR